MPVMCFFAVNVEDELMCDLGFLNCSSVNYIGHIIQ